MAKSVLTSAQREKIEEGGWVHASMVVEVQGNDKDHIKGALERHIEKIKKEAGVDIYGVIFSDPTMFRENLFACNAELKFIAKDYSILAHLALLYSPSSIEIYEPKQINLPLGDAQNILVDISNIVTSLAHTIFIQEGQLRKYKAAEEVQKAAK